MVDKRLFQCHGQPWVGRSRELELLQSNGLWHPTRRWWLILDGDLRVALRGWILVPSRWTSLFPLAWVYSGGWGIFFSKDRHKKRQKSSSEVQALLIPVLSLTSSFLCLLTVYVWRLSKWDIFNGWNMESSLWCCNCLHLLKKTVEVK